MMERAAFCHANCNFFLTPSSLSSRPLPPSLSISQRGPLTLERPTARHAIHASSTSPIHVSLDIFLLLAAEVEPTKLSPTSVAPSLFLVLLPRNKGREVQRSRVGGAERGSRREGEIGSGGGGGGGSWASVHSGLRVTRVGCQHRASLLKKERGGYSPSGDGDVDVKLLRRKRPQVGPSCLQSYSVVSMEIPTAAFLKKTSGTRERLEPSY
jgi:hypothetical protein